MRLSASFELAITVIAVAELLVFGAVALPRFSWQEFSAYALPNGWGGAFAALRVSRAGAGEQTFQCLR